MEKYFMWAGGILIVLVVLVLFITGLYPEYLWCGDFYDDMVHYQMSTTPEVTVTATPQAWVVASHCNGIENSLYLSYYFIALGVALLTGGFVVKR